MTDVVSLAGACYEIGEDGQPAAAVPCPPPTPPEIIASALAQRQAIEAGQPPPPPAKLPSRPVLRPGEDLTTTVPAEVSAARLAVCMPCSRRNARGNCTLLSCGCSVSTWTTRPWATCPERRWPVQSLPS